MPFKSESQHRAFRAMLARGEISQKTFDKWMRETKAKHGKTHPIKPLPERVKSAEETVTPLQEIVDRLLPPGHEVWENSLSIRGLVKSASLSGNPRLQVAGARLLEEKYAACEDPVIYKIAKELAAAGRGEER